MPNWRILIVDDEEDVRRIIRASLATQYEVVEAEDGLDALETLELAEPDFVILDVMMPMMDGFQACAAIRRHPRFRAIPVLFLSALNTKDDIKKGYGVGATLYLTKPFDPSRLLMNVSRFFEENPPPSTKKRFSLAELKALKEAGPSRRAEAHAEVELTLEPEDEEPVTLAPPAEGEAAPDAGPQAWYSGKAISRTGDPLPASAPGRPSVPRRPSGPPKPRVLFVDDDESVLLMAQGLLERDYELATARDGIEAIEKVTALQPDIIALDAMMPKMSGYQLCQSLRRNARFTKTPILFVSAKASPRERDYALRIGGTDFLAKPFSGEQLTAMLKKLQASPDFKVMPKAVSVDQLLQMENRRKSQLEERQDRLHRKEETELEKFLRENT
jgi:CheY-like chemotaxis protein